MTTALRRSGCAVGAVAAEFAVGGSTGGNPRVGRTKEPVDYRNVIDPCDPPPVPKATGNLIGGVGTDVDGVVRRDEPHARVEIALDKSWKPFGESLRLSGHQLEGVAAIPPGDSRNTTTAEGALPVIYEG